MLSKKKASLQILFRSGSSWAYLLRMQVGQASGNVQSYEVPVLVPAQPTSAGIVVRQCCSQIPSLHVLRHHHHLQRPRIFRQLSMYLSTLDHQPCNPPCIYSATIITCTARPYIARRELPSWDGSSITHHTRAPDLCQSQKLWRQYLLVGMRAAILCIHGVEILHKSGAICPRLAPTAPDNKSNTTLKRSKLS